MNSMNARQDLFHIPTDKHYFLAHSIGLQPRATALALQEHFERPWQSGGEDIWPQWLKAISAFNHSLALLLNTNANQICPQTNISSGLTKVISALSADNKRREILCTASDFPSTGFVLSQAEKLGFEIKRLPKSLELSDPNVWIDHITSETAVCFLTHVQYNTNLRLPVEKIANQCRDKGVLSIVDAAQSVGIVPLDLSATAIDVVLGSSIKWLCGGPGAGYLWLSESSIERLEPSDVGWFSHENPFEFDIDHFQYAKTASRFWGGTPNVAPFVAAAASIDTLSHIGFEEIRTHNRRLSTKLMNALQPDQISSPIDLDRKGGTVIFKPKNQESLEKQLRSNGILFDARQYGIRVSPHIYTTDADVDKLVALINDQL